jgi:hypothetical protein
MTRPLRLYWDDADLPEGLDHCLLLIPFKGELHHHDGYRTFAKEGKSFLQRVSKDEADIALLPFDGAALIKHRHEPNPRHVAAARRVASNAAVSGLRTLVIVNSDSSQPVPIDNAIVLRTSLDRRTRQPNEFALPAWHEDLVTNYLDGDIRVRPKHDRPTVAFCGHVATHGPPLKRRIKNLLRYALQPLGYYINHNDGTYLRRDAMLALEADQRVHTAFIRRDGYFGGRLDQSPKSQQDVRGEYVRNLVEADYALDVRGYGNFSFRFFETMSLGRIPVLLDTDRVLPYDFLHDYRDLCVIVPEKDLAHVTDYIVQFHGQLSDDNFSEKQRRIRDHWLTWLSPQGYFREIWRHWLTD